VLLYLGNNIEERLLLRCLLEFGMEPDSYAIERCSTGWLIRSNGTATLICERKKTAICTARRASALLRGTAPAAVDAEPPSEEASS
jgi:hypothetical protein